MRAPHVTAQETDTFSVKVDGVTFGPYGRYSGAGTWAEMAPYGDSMCGYGVFAPCQCVIMVPGLHRF